MLAARRGEAIDNQIYLTQIRLNGLDSALLYRIRKSVAIDTFGIQASAFSAGVKSGRVIPASGGSFFLAAGLFKKHAKGRSTATKGRGDSRGEPVAGR